MSQRAARQKNMQEYQRVCLKQHPNCLDILSYIKSVNFRKKNSGITLKDSSRSSKNPLRAPKIFQKIPSRTTPIVRSLNPLGIPSGIPQRAPSDVLIQK